jgi:hypothetical protein
VQVSGVAVSAAGKSGQEAAEPLQRCGQRLVVPISSWRSAVTEHIT